MQRLRSIRLPPSCSKKRIWANIVTIHNFRAVIIFLKRKPQTYVAYVALLAFLSAVSSSALAICAAPLQIEHKTVDDISGLTGGGSPKFAGGNARDSRHLFDKQNILKNTLVLVLNNLDSYLANLCYFVCFNCENAAHSYEQEM